MPEKIHIGAINVVSSINKIEIPSMPNWKLIKPFIQFFFQQTENLMSNYQKNTRDKERGKNLQEKKKLPHILSFSLCLSERRW